MNTPRLLPRGVFHEDVGQVCVEQPYVASSFFYLSWVAWVWTSRFQAVMRDRKFWMQRHVALSFLGACDVVWLVVIKRTPIPGTRLTI